MAEPESTIVIPVYNQWDMTQACLKSLAETLPPGRAEIIVVDNASTDATEGLCPDLGKAYWGGGFRYVRVSRNINFGPASNLGAKMARGRYLVFLNNDTICMPGWYGRLLTDFDEFPRLAATGPLLLYPQASPLGRMVQHLGIYISPYLNVGHLYEGIPEASPLARKRRFFQAITAACMVMPRQLFYDAGLFDDIFSNGFEDVDLCARLGARGWRFTVNPEAAVLHFQGQSQGRHENELGNTLHYREKTMPLLKPDWHLHVRADGYVPSVNDWLEIQARLPVGRQAEIEILTRNAEEKELEETIIAEPLAQCAWRRYAEINPARIGALAKSWYRIFPGPEPALHGFDQAASTDEKKMWFATLASYSGFLSYFENKARANEQLCRERQLPELAESYAMWLRGRKDFVRNQYDPFMRKFLKIAESLHMPLHPFSQWAYPLWDYLIAQPRRARMSAPANGAAFSIIMPVYNPQPEQLKAALDSVLAQDYPHWELCIADDASTTASTRAILMEYAARNRQIHVAMRCENGGIAAASNTALGMAAYEFAVLLDQDDLLAGDALRIVAAAIAEKPHAMLLYSDEDKLMANGIFFNPYFKGKWDAKLLLTQNFVSHLGVYKVDRLRAIGGFREGFDGAQDYDLLLRYIADLPENAMAHIPHVLYHWRWHQGSTAHKLEAKPEAARNAAKAVEEWLAAAGSEASLAPLPDCAHCRVIYPVPEPRPAASIICDLGRAGQPNAETARAILAAGVSDLIFIDSCDAALAGMRHMPAVTILPMNQNADMAARLNMAFHVCRGEIIGLLAPCIAPIGAGWLAELSACLWQPDVGACAGKIQTGAKLLHGGYAVGADGKLCQIFKGIGVDEPCWFDLPRRMRAIAAADSLCLFTKRSAFLQSGGFMADAGDGTVLDYCLRLGQKGLITLWQPFARFQVDGALPNLMRAERNLHEKWAGKLSADNANLVVRKGDWALCTDC